MIVSSLVAVARKLAFFLPILLTLPIAAQIIGTSPRLVSSPQTPSSANGARGWLRRARVAAYSLSSTNAEDIVRQAVRDDVPSIEIDNDITGRYESLLHPGEKLEALRKVSAAAHAQHRKVFVYIAGLECISGDDSSAHTVAKDHPDWLQRKITGEPAIFDNKAAFWIAKGEEDTWVSPYAKDWRKLYMERVRQIAATGVDGIFVDIPYWMTHFKDWEDTWASFDTQTVEAFHLETGLDAKKDLKLGDFSDPAFRRWVDFRIQTITNFLSEIRQNAVRINPNISLIPEIFPGIESEAVRVGSDVYQIYPVVDAIAHEYEFGAGDDHTAALRSPFDWMMYQIGIRTFRAFAGDRPTWILNYSWDGAPNVRPADAMTMLAMSELMAGANIWDAQGHVMSGSNDMAQRRVIYRWLAAHEDLFSAPRTAIGSVGIYFSDATRNEYADEYIASFRGTVLALLQTHRAFQIVTPRSLAEFNGDSLVLPGVRVLSETELSRLWRFAARGGRIVSTGASVQALTKLPGVRIIGADVPGTFLHQSEKHLESLDAEPMASFLTAMGLVSSAEPKIEAPTRVVTHVMQVDSETRVYLANFSGVEAGKTMVPESQSAIKITVPLKFGKTAAFLPFLGPEMTISGTVNGDHMTFALPAIEWGGVVRFNRQP